MWKYLFYNFLVSVPLGLGISFQDEMKIYKISVFQFLNFFGIILGNLHQIEFWSSRCFSLFSLNQYPSETWHILCLYKVKSSRDHLIFISDLYKNKLIILELNVHIIPVHPIHNICTSYLLASMCLDIQKMRIVFFKDKHYIKDICLLGQKSAAFSLPKS